MVVKIRLARFGRKRQPFYNIVVAHARTARNSKPLEVLGTYDPIPRQDPYDATVPKFKDIKMDLARARYWIGVGAQPSDPAWRLLAMVNILPKRNWGGANPTAASAEKALREELASSASGSEPPQDREATRQPTA